MTSSAAPIDPRYMIIDLTTGELIDLKTFACTHIDPVQPRPLSQAIIQIRAAPVFTPADALAREFFDLPPELN